MDIIGFTVIVTLYNYKFKNISLCTAVQKCISVTKVIGLEYVFLCQKHAEV